MKQKKSIWGVACSCLTLCMLLMACNGEETVNIPSPPPTDTESILPTISASPEINVSAALPVEETQNIEPEYDIFSDPNIHWGVWEDAFFEQSMWGLNYGDVRYGNLMVELLDQLDDDDLVAFRLHTYYDHSLDPDPVVEALPEEVKQDEEVKYWMEHTDAVNAWSHFKDAVRAYARNKAKPFEEVMSLRREAAEATVRDMYEDSGIDEACFEAEVETLLVDDEEYQSAYSSYIYYHTIRSNFNLSIYGQQVVNIRNKFVERGFTPVYEFDLDEQYEIAYEDRTRYRDWSLIFVGPAGVIRELSELIEGAECYWVFSVGKVDPNNPPAYPIKDT